MDRCPSLKWSHLGDFLRNTLAFGFQGRCLLCHGSAERLLCGACLKPYLIDTSWYRCHPARGLDGAYWRYDLNEASKQCLYHFKYLKAYWAFEWFLNQTLQTLPLELASFDAIVPIPLSKNRWIERGFNQSELIAKRISRLSGVRCENQILVKQRQTRSLGLLTKSQRRREIQGAFKCHTKGRKIQRVLLVDDVFTTGATLNEASRVLRQKGCHSIVGWTLFRTPL